MSEQKLHTNPIVIVRRTFPASRPVVFKAWTNPQALQKWFRPFGLIISVGCLDLRAGGSFRLDFQPVGQPPSSITGIYLEIVAPQKLCFTWSSQFTGDKDTLVTVQFEERDNGTEIILTHSRFLLDEMVEKHIAGWQAVMAELGQLLVSPRMLWELN